MLKTEPIRPSHTMVPNRLPGTGRVECLGGLGVVAFVVDRRRVDAAFAEVGEFQIGSVFFFKVFAEEVHDVIQPKLAGP